MKRISATKCGVYDSCPLQFDWTYNKKLLQLINKNFQIGTLYHTCLEVYHGKGLLGGCEPDIDRLASSTQVANKERDIVKMLFEKYKENPIKGDVIDTEKRFKVDLGFDDATFEGVFDRIDVNKIVEYKTSSFDYFEKHTKTVQSKAYCYFYRKMYGKNLPIVYSVINKVKAKGKKYKPQILPISYTDKELDSFENKLKDYYKKLNSNSFEARPDTQCYWCPYGRNGTKNCPYSK